MKELDEYPVGLLKHILEAVNNEDNLKEHGDFKSFGGLIIKSSPQVFHNSSILNKVHEESLEESGSCDFNVEEEKKASIASVGGLGGLALLDSKKSNLMSDNSQKMGL